jgi:RNA polymerase sigma-70 factor, ECF subfamily
MDRPISNAPFGELYRRHRAKAVRVARRILKDPCESEDVVQDVFARLFSRPEAFDGRARYSTWLYRVTVNACINTLRARRRRSADTPPLEGCPDPEAEAIAAQSAARFLAAVRQIPGIQGEVLQLRDVRGLSYPEIAALLGVPEGTVKSALNRGRKKLARLLAPGDATSVL